MKIGDKIEFADLQWSYKISKQGYRKLTGTIVEFNPDQRMDLQIKVRPDEGSKNCITDKNGELWISKFLVFPK